MDIIFSDIAKELMNKSRKEAESLGTPALMPEHMFLSIINNDRSFAYRILLNSLSNSALNEINEELKGEIKNKVYPAEIFELAQGTGRIQITEEFITMLYQAKCEALNISLDNIVCSEHLLLSILKNKELQITQYLYEKGLTYGLARSTYASSTNMFDKYDNNSLENDYVEDEDLLYDSQLNEKTTLLKSISKNLNELAKKGSLDPVIGREEEIERSIQILSRRKKNNILLIGQPGVGKTAIAEGLALEIVNRRVNSELAKKKILALDMASLVAGTKYRGQFEERIKELIEELTQNPDIVLFIDEIHTIIGAGGVGGGALDASNMLKPVLTDGRIQCIGATTILEYKKFIETDGAFARRFHNIMVEQPTPEETLKILNNIKHKYESYHNVVYTDEALKACITLSERYITDRYFPDKAIDALDEAGACINSTINKPDSKIKFLKSQLNKFQSLQTKIKNSNNFEKLNYTGENNKIHEKYKFYQKELEKENLRKLQKYRITEDDIAKVIAQTARVPISKINKKENYNMLNMPKILKEKIIGQDDAIDKIIKTMQRAKIGLRSHTKPIGNFIFLGPTGVGKTSLAKEIAYQIFGKKEALIKIDMSEYMEKYSISGLIGAPPGYVGYEEGGLLTERVHRRPHSIVLLDEIEKAHPDIQNILLQIMDDGFITDGLGKKVDFRNTLLIMTSNIGVRKFEDFGNGIGFHTSNIDEGIQESYVLKEVKKYFSPEFIGRLDDIIVFNSLQKNDILKIVNLNLDGLQERIKSLGYFIKIDAKSKEFLVEKGHSNKYGVRPILRAIKDYIEDPLTEKIINNDIKVGETFSIKKPKNSLNLKITTIAN